MTELRHPAARVTASAALLVFVLAVVLRVPSCYESFWVDELHSAWTIWGTLPDVFPRAQLGHQSPFYFVGLWFWKQVFGGSEVMLRLSSVLAVSAAAALLTVGIARLTKSNIAGLTAGSVLAFEQNSLFFGTELRPYSWVILCSAVAVVCFAKLAHTRSRHQAAATWVIFVATILVALLFQPTSLGVLIAMPVVLVAIWSLRDRASLTRVSLADGLMVLGAAAVMFYLWRYSLQQSWQQRFTWAAFATATELDQLWRVWDWIVLLVVPGVATMVGLLVASSRRGLTESDRDEVRTLAKWVIGWSIMAIAVTFLYWIASYAGVAPVWHRRYFVAVLPIFAATTGYAVAAIQKACVGERGSAIQIAATTAIAALLVLSVPAQQGVLSRLTHYPVALVHRGENWRGAAELLREEVRPNDLVFLDGGLIENAVWMRRSYRNSKPPARVPLTSAESDYLTYMVRGPYAIDHDARPLDVSQLTQPWRVLGTIQSERRRIFLVIRQPLSAVKPFVSPEDSLHGFGNVTVVTQSKPSP